MSSARRASIGETVATRIDDLLPLKHTPSKEPQPPVAAGEKTIKYLAYGSNLCAKTFLGRRGIKPLAQINVIVPSLRLVFDLPGICYYEPRFGNVNYRETPGNDDGDEEEYVRRYLSDPSSFSTADPNSSMGLQDRPLIGVVYEVTPTDYYHIIATEGGYDQVSVRCHALPESSLTTTNESTFDAMTLLAPRRITRPDHAGQPSLRYLNLIRTGAEEHSLPESYREYLAALEPYTKTSKRQVIGGVLFAIAWAPAIMSMMVLKRIFSDKKGKAPNWLVVYSDTIIRSAWMTYDVVWKKVWGDGEQTQKSKSKTAGKDEAGEKIALKKGGDGKTYGSTPV